MQFLTVLLPLAALAVAEPLKGACSSAVAGSAALADAKLRASHCSSFLATTVTPPAVTVTTTVTSSSSKAEWKRGPVSISVTVCPNEVPDYATACDDAAYTSACSGLGYSIQKTTIAPTTTTKTVYVLPTSACASVSTTTVTSKVAASTVTVTSTASASTVTVTATPTPPTPAKCLSASQATGIVNNFIDLLEYTSYVPANGSRIPPGRGYHFNVSAITLAPDFVDISDSINFMAGFPLGSVTFPNKTAFDYGQGILQPEVDVTTLNIFPAGKSITWRWVLKSNPAALPVTGINYMIINDKGLIQKNYAEFDNGAWLQSFGQSCALRPVAPPVTPALKRSMPLLRKAA